MLKRVLIGLVILLGILVIVGFLLPDDVHVERSTVIAAPACTIYAQLVDYHRFNEWSPWAALDPATQYTFSGADYGPGAKMSWSSEDKGVGSGSQEITAADPYTEVRSHLDFGDQGEADSLFQLAPAEGGTQVTWAFDTSFEGSIIGHYFGLFMDSMVGSSFEEGLANLKKVAEGLPDTDWCDAQIEVVEVNSRTIVTSKGESSTEPEDIGANLGAAFGRVQTFLGEHELTPVGPPLAIAESFGEDGYRFEAGLAVASAPAIETAEDSAVIVREMPATRAIRAVHTGPYEQLEATYNALEGYMAARGLKPSGFSWEEYMNDPTTTPADQLETHVFFPIGG